MPQLPGSHGGWLGKSVCRLRWRSVPAGGRRSRRGGTRRDRRRTLRSSPSSSLVVWEDALQIAPAGKLFVHHVANTLWTKTQKKDVNTVILFVYFRRLDITTSFLCVIYFYLCTSPLKLPHLPTYPRMPSDNPVSKCLNLNVHPAIDYTFRWGAL